MASLPLPTWPSSRVLRYPPSSLPPRAALVPSRPSAMDAAASPGASVVTRARLPSVAEIPTERDGRGLLRLRLQEEGYETWTWQGHKVNYAAAGPLEETDTERGPPLVLIHGFGASVYHWRYNIPQLGERCRVYALDLLGLGWSAKADVDYNPALWSQQVSDFVRQVVGEPAVIVGNSVGGYTALSTAAAHADTVAALVLVNSAGKFKVEKDAPSPPSPAATNTSSSVGSGSSNAPVEEEGVGPSAVVAWVVEKAQAWIQRAAIYVAFVQARRPARIQQVLETVYADRGSLDDSLVRSIAIPASDPDAAETYYRLLTQVMLHPSSLPVNQLLTRVRERGGTKEDAVEESGGKSAGGRGPTLPVLLLWGEKDPWCTPAVADRIMEFFPEATRVNLSAGHCPHDEVPEEFNGALLAWWEQLH